ncbi:hypothetical protein BKA93DRAFT_372197 [Sparassis latifolia]
MSMFGARADDPALVTPPVRSCDLQAASAAAREFLNIGPRATRACPCGMHVVCCYSRVGPPPIRRATWIVRTRFRHPAYSERDRHTDAPPWCCTPYPFGARWRDCPHLRARKRTQVGIWVRPRLQGARGSVRPPSPPAVLNLKEVCVRQACAGVGWRGGGLVRRRPFFRVWEGRSRFVGWCGYRLGARNVLLGWSTAAFWSIVADSRRLVRVCSLLWVGVGPGVDGRSLPSCCGSAVMEDVASSWRTLDSVCRA